MEEKLSDKIYAEIRNGIIDGGVFCQRLPQRSAGCEEVWGQQGTGQGSAAHFGGSGLSDQLSEAGVI